MTNGEKFRKTFKNVPCGISNDKKFINAWYTEDGYCIIPIEWWNAEYKEPTHKESLVVEDVIALSFSEDIDEPNKYQTIDGQWHEGMIPCDDASGFKLSRDDAIEVLKDWDGYFIGHSSDDVVKAINLAIKALEHPEKNVVAVVPCGDAISREEVLKLMKENWHSKNGDWAMQESLDDIRALPSVQIKPRTGHWTCDRANVRCSCCGTGYKDFYGKANIMSYSFCPNCGAKMVKPQESEDKE